MAAPSGQANSFLSETRVMAKPPVVFVVDDDTLVRKLIAQLLRVSGYRVELFATAQEFLEFLDTNRTSPVGCLVLDLQLPGMNGLELQRILVLRGNRLPIVFVTGHGDIRTCVKAMKTGAVDFLPKPFTEETFLSAVRGALGRSRHEDGDKSEDLVQIQERLARLTPREAEVLLYVAAGRVNKETADQLGIAEHTVKIHRARIMKKLRVHSIGELVRLAIKAGLPLPSSSP